MFSIIAVLASLNVQAKTSTAGIVLMHGKGGSPTKYVSDLASLHERDGYFVANLEMPLSRTDLHHT